MFIGAAPGTNVLPSTFSTPVTDVTVYGTPPAVKTPSSVSDEPATDAEEDEITTVVVGSGGIALRGWRWRSCSADAVGSAIRNVVSGRLGGVGGEGS